MDNVFKLLHELWLALGAPSWISGGLSLAVSILFKYTRSKIKEIEILKNQTSILNVKQELMKEFFNQRIDDINSNQKK